MVETLDRDGLAGKIIDAGRIVSGAGTVRHRVLAVFGPPDTMTGRVPSPVPT
jgi:hypothetical protein